MRGRPMRHPDLATGHRQHLRLVDGEVPPKRRVPPVPVGLSKEGSAHWRRLWRSRVAVEWDTESDRAAVERYLRMLERWRSFDQLVARAPLVQGSKGQLRPNPLTTQVVALEGQVRALEEQLGLTPASRVRLGLRFAPEPSPERVFWGGPEDSTLADEFALPEGFELVDASVMDLA